ncbi:hypothetical protein HNR60_001608 [Rhodopseudomonas rhenobacensis]|uniref:Uncharacterized protein n=1 Tax=Rhodopseudomonas rhenobacensis TaxID=87461 RepID=A0A7W7Z2Q6_9BRAD|nr:hypothetical protein [Rhodopseudomonas rhenobacensis]MBB5046859.1 hypothetical protein [Rhodopseudomonas rhenobacensis]
MKLFHYSYAPIEATHICDQRSEPHHKPRGLWFAEGASWRKESESWRSAEAFAHRYQVVTAPEANIARLDTPENAAAFGDQFGYVYDGEVIKIRWADVAREFDGVHLGFFYSHVGFRHPARKQIEWSFAFDVIGGCVWHPRAFDLIDCRTRATVPSTANVRPVPDDVSPFRLTRMQTMLVPMNRS